MIRIDNRNEEFIVAGTLCAGYAPATYRTKDGSAYYKFRYVDIGGKFEIDILQQPTYSLRDSSQHITHRLHSDRGGMKICISTGFEPGTLEKAKKISVEWAELTNTFIKTGKTIDQQVIEITRSNNMQRRTINTNNERNNYNNNSTVYPKGFWGTFFEELGKLLNN